MSEIATALAQEVVDQVERDPLMRSRLRKALGVDRPDTGPTVFTTKTLAAEVGVTEETIRRAIRRGDLRARRRGKAYVICRRAVEEWADTGQPARGRQSPTPPTRRRRQLRPLRSTLDEIAGSE